MGARPLTLVIEPELMERLENFRFERRFRSRSAAVKHLLELGLRQVAPQTTPAPRPSA